MLEFKLSKILTDSVIEKLHKSVATIYLANSGHNGLSSIV